MVPAGRSDQTRLLRIRDHYTKWKNQIYACCPGDLNFMGSTTGQLSGLEHQPTAWEIARDTPLGDLAAAKIRWRYQKNLFHGEEIDFVANPDSDFCPVIATKNIVERHQKLNMGEDTPLAVYKRNKHSNHGTHFVSLCEKRCRETTKRSSSMASVLSRTGPETLPSKNHVPQHPNRCLCPATLGKPKRTLH